MQVIADADRFDLGKRVDTRRYRLREKIDAAVGIIFPAIFTVENDADQRRSAPRWPCGVADGLDLAEEVVDRLIGLVALIMKADLIAHGMIAKHHLHVLPFFFHAPGTIQHFGMRRDPCAIARDPTLGRGERISSSVAIH